VSQGIRLVRLDVELVIVALTQRPLPASLVTLLALWCVLADNITLLDLKDIDLLTYDFFQTVKDATKEDFQGGDKDIEINFTVNRFDKSEVELIPDGSCVQLTHETKDLYLENAVQFKLNEGYIQAMEIRRGLVLIILESLLHIITWEDLKLSVCKNNDIDIELLKRHTEYSIVSENTPHIEYFWATLRSFSSEEKRAFLKFAWAQERLPINDFEFVRTRTRMFIKPFPGLTGNPDYAFPKADTCFFNLMLPEYSSAEILKERLLFAIFTDSDSMNADLPHEEPVRNRYTSDYRYL